MSPEQRHVSLVAVPESLLGPVTSIYEAFNLLGALGRVDDSVPADPPFRVEIVSEARTVECTSNGLTLPTHRSFDEVERTDIVIVPSMMLEESEWVRGRERPVVDWMRAVHARGARLCGACTGAFLVADTGLLDGWEATVHPAFANAFRHHYPDVDLRLECVLIATGRHGEFVTSGASSAWHDLVLYLVAHHAGPAVAQALARFMLIQWHEHGQGPYISFSPPLEHGDAAIRRVQDWLGTRYAGEAVLEEMCRVADLSERSLKRRFREATGYTPTSYVQHLRIEEAKRRLERTDDPIEAVGWAVGYQNAAFFRRLFKRLTGVTPGTYRRQFRVPDFGGVEVRAAAPH